MSGPGRLASDHHPTLRHVERQAVAIELQHVLVTLVDLALLGKQAHWNVVGPNFRPTHRFLDELVDRWREAADQVAERSAALGGEPDGTAATVAARTPLAQLPQGPLPDHEVVAFFTLALTDAVGEVRARMDPLEDVDAVTADVLHGVVAGLEEALWMMRVQLEPAVRRPNGA